MCICTCEWIASALQLHYWWDVGLGDRDVEMELKQKGNNTSTKDDDVVPHCSTISLSTLSCDDARGGVLVGTQMAICPLERQYCTPNFKAPYRSALDWDWVSTSLNIDQVAIVRWILIAAGQLHISGLKL